MERSMRQRAPLVLALLLAACAADGGDGGNQPQAALLMCSPGSSRACPCAGMSAATGMQSCDATGRSYGACTGCPAAAAAPAQPAPAGAAAQAGAGGAQPGAAIDAGAQLRDAAEPGVGSDPTLDQAGAVPGTSCGVGLPRLCAHESEKCCVRSLATDTCIAAAAECECDLQGCTVMETYCDGPEDCAQGEFCCGTLADNGAGYDSFICSAQCQAMGNQRVACHVDETECPSDYICANSQLLTNVQVCIDPASIEQ